MELATAWLSRAERDRKARRHAAFVAAGRTAIARFEADRTRADGEAAEARPQREANR